MGFSAIHTKLVIATLGSLCLLGATQPDSGMSRNILPVPAAEFQGKMAEHVNDGVADNAEPVRAPKDAPNILLFMSDDVGFAMASSFGGPVPTPNFEKIAKMGVRFNRFHTTGVCSPSRASLLTGRNHHNAGVGYLSDLPNGFPGYGGKILRSTATIAEILKLNGYNTAMFGKHHNVPTDERSAAGPFDSWPTGLGFEYFFGFVGGDTDQFQPNLYRGIHRFRSDEAPDDILEKRIADDIISWVHNQRAGDPSKPFLIYLAPASTHAPHQVPANIIDRFRGQFDHGWDIERARIFRRQQAAGLIPSGTKLTSRPEEIPAWNSLNAQEKAFAIRSMEVAAAQLAYQDEQLGRIINELERMGELDRTLIALVGGDNGADTAAGHHGTINELRSIANSDESVGLLHANISNLGTPETYANYPAGWAWSMNTPFRWGKHHSSMLGGIRNGMILSWPGHAKQPGSICSRFSHVNDLAPTILDAAQLPAPSMVLGTQQKNMDGESLLDSLSQCEPEKSRTQYFEIGGKIGLYSDGWFLSGDDQRLPWKALPPEGERPNVNWSLYNLSTDFSQSTDISMKSPDKLAAMKDLWQSEANRNNVFPLDHRFAEARARALVKASGRSRFEFWGKDVSLPANLEPRLSGRSYTLVAAIKPDTINASGVIAALGSKFGGWSLFLDRGKLAFAWAGSTDPNEMAQAQASELLPAGTREVTMQFVAQRPGGSADIIISSGGKTYLTLKIPMNILRPAGGGETFDIGRDLGVAVTKYQTPNGIFEGDISHLQIIYN